MVLCSRSIYLKWKKYKLKAVKQWSSEAVKQWSSGAVEVGGGGSLLLLLLSKDTLSSKRRPLRHWKEQKALLLFLVGTLLSACKSDVVWLTAFGRGVVAILTSIYIYIHETLMCPLNVFLISSLSRTQGNLARSCESVSEIKKSNFVLDPQSYTNYHERGLCRTSAFQRCMEVEELTACVMEFSSTCDGFILDWSSHARAFDLEQLTCWH